MLQYGVRNEVQRMRESMHLFRFDSYWTAQLPSVLHHGLYAERRSTGPRFDAVLGSRESFGRREEQMFQLDLRDNTLTTQKVP